MQPAKKNLSKVLSAISMAAAATLAAKTAQAQITITPFYGQATSTSNADGVFVYNNAETAATVESVTGSSPTTINMVVGDYLFLAVDAVITGDTNADGGKQTGTITTAGTGAKKTITTTQQVQPSNLGLAAIGISVPSTDTNASKLAPLSDGTQIGGSPSYSEGYGYETTAGVNTSVGNNTTGKYPPAWAGVSSVGDTESGSGSVALNDYIGGGNTTVVSNQTTGINTLQMFTGSSATDAQATQVFNSLQYEAMANGTVTLSPYVVSGATNYWALETGGSSTTASVYNSPGATAGQIGSLPLLVIKIGSVVTGPTGHAVVSLAAGTSPGANYGSNVASLTLPYSTASFTATATDSASAQTWNPATETEIFGVDVLYSGVQATPTELAPLITAINSGDANVPGAVGVVASLGSGVFPSNFNLILTAAPGVGTSSDLGLDLSSANDPLLAGLTFNAVAVVPEPMSLGILALGGVGLMARRHRRKA